MNTPRAALLLLLSVVAPLPGLAQPDIPDALEPWRDWVLFGQEFRACPVLLGRAVAQTDSHVCAWPGELDVEVEPDTARFEQSWTLYTEEWVPLPGDARYWPAAVTVDGVPQAAVLRSGRPMVRAAAGTHRIAGEIRFETRPASIPVPPETGLIALTLDGTAVPLPQLEQGALWLGLRPDLVVEEDRLDIAVYRRLTDSLPVRIETRIQLDIAGQSRELALSGALLADFVGEALASDLPAELDADGTLRIQARPGRWTATVIAHHPGTVTTLTRPAVVPPWPAEEVWSFQSLPLLRVAVLEGAPAVDSRRAGVPGGWQSLPSYAVAADVTVELAERSRNDALDDNQLTLARYLWLDFDGAGFTARDSVTGTLQSGWRLDMAPPYTMTSAAIGNENLLVTEGDTAGTQGVELRTTGLNLLATARLADVRALPVTGYTDDFDTATTTLFLPPAHRLLAAPGADIAAGAWIERWRLLDIFLALIIAVASWRLFGWAAGGIALATMLLVFHEPWAPRYAWLNLLLIIALLRVVPAGRMRGWCERYRLASVAVLALLLAPFAALQLRVVVFPQLERGFVDRGIEAPSPNSGLAGLLGASVADLRGLNPMQGSRTLTLVNSQRVQIPAAGAPETVVVTGNRVTRDDFTSTDSNFVITSEQARQRGQAEFERLAEPPLGFADPSAIPSATVGRIETMTGGASATFGADAMAGVVNVALDPGPVSRYQPNALVQTGPGLPDWAWSRHLLGFSGPVTPADSYSLVILGPFQVALWRIASVAFALAFAWLLLGSGTLRTRRRHGDGGTAGGAGSSGSSGGSTSGTSGGNARPGAATAAGIAALALLTVALPNSSEAQTSDSFPPLELLNELRNRLTAPAPCHPSCAELTEAAVTLADDRLRLELELALQDAVAVPVPGNAQIWRPEQITVDGASQRQLFRDASGQAWIRLDAGVRRVRLEGRLPATDSLPLPFPLPPRFITVEAPGWDITGVSENRLASGTLELIRQRAPDADGDDAIRPSAFPPYVQVTRQIRFGIDWTVATIVQRVAPRDGAFTLPVSLLPGESVVTQDIEVRDGIATAAFAAGQSTVIWQSRLPTGAAMTLTAAADQPWTEAWLFDVGHEWHAEFTGLPRTQTRARGNLVLLAEYLPRPGETLELALSRPEPVTGDTIAIDAVDYRRRVGDRATTGNVDFAYRSTRAVEHPIRLPEGSELESVVIDGTPVPLRIEDSVLSLPVTTGTHRVAIGWREPNGIGLHTRLTPVDFGAGASNITTHLALPADRWILFTHGPTLGPAVLYWAELAVFVLAAFVLGRIAWSPLRTHEWLLLGLGLSTFSWPVLFFFAAWAFLMSWRGRRTLSGHRYLFNAGQILLALITLAMLAALAGSIANGLLGEPNMHLRTPVSGGDGLSWFLDRSDGTTPAAGAITVSLWFYKAAMLAWALWLSFAVLRWLRFAWQSISFDGLWRSRDPATQPGAA